MVKPLSYTVREVCDATGIGRNTILREIHAKRLKAFRVGEKGQKWIVPKSAVETWLERQVSEAETA